MKKLVALSLALVVLALPMLALGEVTKDETVYALLDASGALRETLVVSHIETPEAGGYVDYGHYSDVRAMVIDAVPSVDGDTITWDLPADAGGFYAAGTMEDAALPFAVHIEYRLEGAVIVPEALAGLGGHAEITLDITPNAAADPAFADGYMAQVQVPLSLAKVSKIEAPGATGAIVGQTQTMTYTVLPGQSARFTLSFDTDSFALDSITIACAPMDIGGMLGLDVAELVDQATALSDGARELADGGTALADGLTTLADGMQTLADESAALPGGISHAADGITQLTDALATLPDAMAQLQAGSQALTDGVSGYVQGVDAALSGVGALSEGLNTLAANGETLAASIGQLQAGLTQMAAMLPQAQATALSTQLTALVDGVNAYTQGVSEVAAQVQAMAEGTTALQASGSQLADGISQQNAGLTTLADGMGQMATQAAAVPEGLAALQTGAQQLTDGIGEINTAVQALPAQTTTLADGQTALADGLSQAIALLDDIPAGFDAAAALPSFASPAHTARSVQFVYRTDAIAVPAPEKEAAGEAAPQSFWDRLIALF